MRPQTNRHPGRRTSAVLCAITLAGLIAGCVEENEEARPIDPARILAEVEAQVWAFHAADTAKNAEGVIALLWPDFSMLADGNRVSYDDAVGGSRQFMASLELFATEWTDLRITPIGADAAVASFQFRDSIITSAGDLIQKRGPTSFVWQRRDGEWRVLFADADHYPIEP
jgi:hypothetical protein